LRARNGIEEAVHPNDHVNMSQSSNDTFPTANAHCCGGRVKNALIPAIKTVRDAIAAKAKEFECREDCRTICDAVP